MPPALLITTNEQLATALEMLSGSTFIALDTEFMRERTYYASLCLIQAATPDACVIIDPLAGMNLQPLWTFLNDRSRLKVLHSGRQDLEVLTQAMTAATDTQATVAAAVPGPIFDTQIAAALLGSPAQVGYATLIAERLGHSLPKAHTRADWSRRPLPAEQLEYAADDVRYLVPLYLDLQTALSERGRMEWQNDEAREMEDPTLYRVEPADAWRRLKGLERLRPDQRATIKLIAQWREARAMRKDKPRGWILADESVRAIAERMPTSRVELDTVEGLSANFLRKRSEEVVDLVKQGRANAASEAPAMVPARPDPALVARTTKLLALVRSEAQRLDVAPELLATRRDVEQIVFSGRSDHMTTGWRREVIGEKLIAANAAMTTG